MENFGFEITVFDGHCSHKYKLKNNALMYISIEEFVKVISDTFDADTEYVGLVNETKQNDNIN